MIPTATNPDATAQPGGSQLDLEPPGCAVLVIGCGNLLRGDDGVGPILVRHLWERGMPDGLRLVDGGTAGMDVAFQMRGAERVVIVDASATGARPGTIYRVPGAELAELPPLEGLHTHSFRWDHAIAFARWALADACPSDVTVFLIEAANVALGAELSPEVATAMDEVMEMIEAEYISPLRPPEPSDPADLTVQFTADGYLRLSAALSAAHFPAHVAVGAVHDDQLWLLPLRGPRNGGLLLKQRTPAGDRAVLVREVLDDVIPAGVRRAFWDDEHGALRIPLEQQ
ncbi:hydrogenase maturation protease [Mycobacterium sp. UM_CSW]|uniref:hydrogenase maturation protease n=1 Tax=Mycobacterium sp. UM_CSW TaxID=1370119 RepID=UPI0003F51862|nr:hydrogenase maturation protease [Mycobacterium sp. UM_CSW]